jgi:hypothetical protein
MMASYPVRVRIGILTLMLFSLLSNVSNLRGSFDPSAQALTPSDLSRYEIRFRLLKKALPPRGVVGYLSEPKLHQGSYLYEKNFYLTQYAVAPVLVVENTEPDLVIGNFKSSSGPDIEIAKTTLVLVMDFGDGVLLLSHRPR